MKIKRNIILLLLLFISVSVVGCNKKNDEEAISVYLWSNVLYSNGYVEYIQEQLPDVKLEFIVGNNDLDYYKFLNENGSLPDIITTRRFSLRDSYAIKDQLMDLSTSDVCGQIYDSYIKDFTNSDGSINWLPLCGEVDGIVANTRLFEQYNIEIPTDYDSFIAACQAFNNLTDEEGNSLGISGFKADFYYDYTCLALLQGLSISQLKSTEGKIWRQSYGSSVKGAVGLDSNVWPGCFNRMEKFINDVGLNEDDLAISYSTLNNLFVGGKVAMIRTGGANAVAYDAMDNMDAMFLPYFGPNNEEWLLTYPAFHVALNKNCENNKGRKQNALKVLEVMLSEGAQTILAQKSDVISYSKNVNLELSEVLDNLKPVIESNHLFIRIASNDFFAVSKDIVSKMMKKELNASQAYESFDAQLKNVNESEIKTILSIEKGYSNKFTENGNESFSVMASTLRQAYGVDLLLAPSTSFTGTVIAGNYTEKMVGYMIMPNALDAYRTTLSGQKIFDFVKKYVEGKAAGYQPFNDGSLPISSGMTLEIEKADSTYKLLNIYVDGQPIVLDQEYTFMVLSTAQYMGSFLADEALGLKKESLRVIKYWIQYIADGGTLAEPEKYIILKNTK